MAYIELVIKIPEDVYKHIQSLDWKNTRRWYSEEVKAIHNGTPLPKGHGRLIDAEKLLDTFWAYCKQGDFGYHQAEDLIKSAQPIIDADGGAE